MTGYCQVPAALSRKIPRDRPLSEAEAWILYDQDRKNGVVESTRYYEREWRRGRPWVDKLRTHYHEFLNAIQAAGDKHANAELSKKVKPPEDAGPERKRKRSPASRPPDISEELWSDFLALRRAKKAPLTKTALNMIAKEATTARISLSKALEVCCARGWQGFKAEWISDDPKQERPAESIQRAQTQAEVRSQEDAFHKEMIRLRTLYANGASFRTPEFEVAEKRALEELCKRKDGIGELARAERDWRTR